MSRPILGDGVLSRCLPLAVLPMAHPASQLEGRLAAVLQPRRRRGTMTRRMILAATVGLAATVTPLAVFRPVASASAPASPASQNHGVSASLAGVAFLDAHGRAHWWDANGAPVAPVAEASGAWPAPRPGKILRLLAVRYSVPLGAGETACKTLWGLPRGAYVVAQVESTPTPAGARWDRVSSVIAYFPIKSWQANVRFAVTPGAHDPRATTWTTFSNVPLWSRDAMKPIQEKIAFVKAVHAYNQGLVRLYTGLAESEGQYEQAVNRRELDKIAGVLAPGYTLNGQPTTAEQAEAVLRSQIHRYGSGYHIEFRWVCYTRTEANGRVGITDIPYPLSENASYVTHYRKMQATFLSTQMVSRRHLLKEQSSCPRCPIRSPPRGRSTGTMAGVVNPAIPSPRATTIGS